VRAVLVTILSLGIFSCANQRVETDRQPQQVTGEVGNDRQYTFVELINENKKIRIADIDGALYKLGSKVGEFSNSARITCTRAKVGPRTCYLTMDPILTESEALKNLSADVFKETAEVVNETKKISIADIDGALYQLGNKVGEFSNYARITCTRAKAGPRTCYLTLDPTLFVEDNSRKPQQVTGEVGAEKAHQDVKKGFVTMAKCKNNMRKAVSQSMLNNSEPDYYYFSIAYVKDECSRLAVKEQLVGQAEMTEISTRVSDLREAACSLKRPDGTMKTTGEQAICELDILSAALRNL
jgi:hypothetical protein